MPICKLCRINEANKTGSHNVPLFLIKSVDNEIGTKIKNKELGFKIEYDPEKERLRLARSERMRTASEKKSGSNATSNGIGN